VTVAPGSTFWFSESWSPDSQQRILALGSLIQTDAPKVIPMLKDIALESPDPSEASRAIFVLAQSGRPEAHTTVLEVAREGTELVQMAAVRELGRFGGPNMTEELLKVYSTSAARVKNQVVNALGDRRARTALMQIVQRESDRQLQERAIIRLAQAGGRQELRQFYDKAATNLKTPIIVGLFNAGAEAELRAIAEHERDDAIRREALTRINLLNSARIRANIEKREQNR
jgi:HEAT repeat protein